MIYFIDLKHFENAISNCYSLVSGQTNSDITIHNNGDIKKIYITREDALKKLMEVVVKIENNEQVPEIVNHGKTISENDLVIMYETIIALCDVMQDNKISLDSILTVSHDSDFFWNEFFNYKNKETPGM